MYFLKVSASNSSDSISQPGNLLAECGTYKPPSEAPFKAPKTLAPVVVLVKPTSKKTLNGLGASSTASVNSNSPSTSSTPW
ncbi:hypothetical protein WICPIJ_007834 [Wickerhamomyces pijperi]|uniref:Uncharacterized protein n=1 Tax=Wickerhamomyces pijperi TaxID=599730 RepID=A0A9P8TJK4_WICPI|nr:hypothetical protein WICPIJ_007834 [Wickerhamomyces pijperi]